MHAIYARLVCEICANKSCKYALPLVVTLCWQILRSWHANLINHASNAEDVHHGAPCNDAAQQHQSEIQGLHSKSLCSYLLGSFTLHFCRLSHQNIACDVLIPRRCAVCALASQTAHGHAFSYSHLSWGCRQAWQWKKLQQAVTTWHGLNIFLFETHPISARAIQARHNGTIPRDGWKACLP